MSLGSERAPETGAWDNLKERARRLGQRADTAAARTTPLAGWSQRLPVVRFISASIVRRIVLVNLFALAMLLGGIWYLSEHRTWLIEAKRESLKAQADIIAAGIAANAKVDRGQFELDPDKLPEAEGSLVPFRDDGFAALELSLDPERVTPVLRRLIQSTDIRARIYGRDGTLIADTQTLVSRGQILNSGKEKPPRTKSFWTRMHSWWSGGQLPVYREIGTAKGTAYPEVRAALAGSSTPMMMLNAQREQIVSMAVPIRRAKSIAGALLLSTRPGDIDEDLGREFELIAKLAGIALLTTLLTSLWLSTTVAEPMRRLSEAAEGVSRDINLRQDLPNYADRNDEVGQMSRAFRSMTAALYQRIEASEKFAADVAHELKNPLTAARSTAESLGYARTEQDRAEAVAQIQSELKRLNRLITDVSNASRLNAELARQHMKPIDVTHVLSGVAAMHRDLLSGSSKKVVLQIAPADNDQSYLVNGDEGRLAQVINNVIDNAVSFSPEDGTVTIGARQDAAGVEVTVDDEGPGIPEDRLKIIFDRFYTDRPLTEAIRGKNSGLGLSISREIIEAHGGQIWAENRQRTAPKGAIGSRFVVRLPRSLPPYRGVLGGRRH